MTSPPTPCFGGHRGAVEARHLTLCRPIQLLALLARSDAAKDLEILVLRHQVTVLRSVERLRLEPADRALFARRQPRAAPSRLVLLPRQARHAVALAPPPRGGRLDLPAPWNRATATRPATAGPDRPPGHGEPALGYQRIQDELLRLGLRVSATAIRTTQRRHGLDPTPRPTATTWRAFLRRQAAGIIACDLLHRRHRLAATALRLVLHRTGHPPVHLAGVTANHNATWVTQQARNLLLRLEDQERRVRFLIRDRDAKFCCGFDDVFRAEGSKVLVTPVQAPNAALLRWL